MTNKGRVGMKSLLESLESPYHDRVVGAEPSRTVLWRNQQAIAQAFDEHIHHCYGRDHTGKPLLPKSEPTLLEAAREFVHDYNTGHNVHNAMVKFVAFVEREDAAD